MPSMRDIFGVSPEPWLWEEDPNPVLSKPVMMIPLREDLLKEPTAEDMTRWRAMSIERDRKLAAAILIHTQHVHQAPYPLKSILELHAPTYEGSDYQPVCRGCDGEGYDCEWPQWPCRTIDALLREIS